MKRLFWLLFLVPSLSWAQGFTPDAASWNWSYSPDTTILYSRTIDNDEMANNPASIFGYDEWVWEIHQLTRPDSCMDTVQFTLWGTTTGHAWDSL
jgi:hypothetical protein